MSIRRTWSRFVDRLDAGRALASKLRAYSNHGDVVVLGLARGGVIVASAIANALQVALDVSIVSKIGTPWNEELAERGVQVLDLSIQQPLLYSTSCTRSAEASSQPFRPRCRAEPDHIMC
jgi:putative phosphoribosyl transferase